MTWKWSPPQARKNGDFEPSELRFLGEITTKQYTKSSFSGLEGGGVPVGVSRLSSGLDPPTGNPPLDLAEIRPEGGGFPVGISTDNRSITLR